MSLPIFTTPEDIDGIVAYLKTKPAGATISDAEAIVKKLVDWRKLAAYIFWNIATKENGKLKLASLGWELSRKTKTRIQVLREILDSVIPYRSALEWMYHQTLKSVSNSDVASHWHNHHQTALGTDKENTMKDQAVCFFRLVEGSGLGKITVGRNGSATRIDLDRPSLEAYVQAGPTVPPLSDSLPEEEPLPAIADESLKKNLVPPPVPPIIDKPPALKVFITHGKNLELVSQVEAVLGVAEIQFEVAVKEETTAIPIPEKVFGAMRRCTAGIIIVTKEQVQDKPNEVQINANVLIEIGAAFVLYDRRVVLLWEKDMPVPSNLQGLYRCEFEGKELGWAAGMKLMKAIKDFRK